MPNTEKLCYATSRRYRLASLRGGIQRELIYAKNLPGNLPRKLLLGNLQTICGSG
jgi:hypothetical protein